MKIFLLVLSIIHTVQAICPKESQTTPYGCLVFSIIPLLPYQAEGLCEYLGGNLAAIHSAEENQYIASLAQGKLNTETVLIGAYRGSNGTWMNRDGSPLDYVNFNNDTLWNSGPFLVASMDLNVTFGNWQSSIDAYTQYPFVCRVSDCGSQQANNTRKCPSGTEYAQSMDRCLLGAKRLPLGVHQRSYWQTEMSCVQLGGHLVSIGNAFQNSEIQQIAKDYLLDDFYIGYQDEMDPNPCKPWELCDDWYWTDNSATTYTNFAKLNAPVDGNGTIAIFQTNAFPTSNNGKWRQAFEPSCTEQHCMGSDWMCSLPTYKPNIC